MGIAFGVTPATGSEIVQQVVGCESVRVARESLARRGLDLGHESVLNLVNKIGNRIVSQHDAWLFEWRNKDPKDVTGGPLAGKRVVIAPDGGRIRLRVPRGGRPQSNGHRRYEAPWVEPKELTIYVIDETGRRDEEFRVVLDGTIGDADALYDRLIAYLKALGAHEAENIIVLGDGAPWIWNRVQMLISAVGIKPELVIQILDNCHAVGKLSPIAESAEFASVGEKKSWLKAATSLLRAGKIEELIQEMKRVVKPRPLDDATVNADTEEKEPNDPLIYFERNKERMRYAAFKKLGYPIGSGGIESAIRRVINLRIKATSKFWLKENAEHMLRMRSYLKAGRFDDLYRWSTTTACSWWCTPHDLLDRKLAPQGSQERAVDDRLRLVAVA